jgi:hypothetical protein
MSKFYFFAAALCLPIVNYAQVIVDFESFEFPQGQNYWNGNQENGSFTLNGATFTNSNFTFYWNGFSVSALGDTTTPGYENELSAFAGSGVNNSEKFGVYYPSGSITFDVPTQPVSIAVTNTTYAALSMRDGDAYAKKFGSIFGADGEEDGTNGKDWFKLTAIGLDADDEVTNEVAFYLADFRSDDSLQHFILDQWGNMDLSSLGTVHKILFELHSTDNGQFGMNTPAYFAFDNLTFFQSGVGLPQNSSASYAIYPNPAQDVVTLRETNYQTFSLIVSNAQGAVVVERDASQEHKIDVRSLPNGVYFLQMTGTLGTKTERIVVAH